MLTPREKSLQEKLSPEEDQTHHAASSRTASPTHNQRAIHPDRGVQRLKCFICCRKKNRERERERDRDRDRETERQRQRQRQTDRQTESDRIMPPTVVISATENGQLSIYQSTKLEAHNVPFSPT